MGEVLVIIKETFPLSFVLVVLKCCVRSIIMGHFPYIPPKPENKKKTK